MKPREKALNLVYKFENFSFEDISRGESAFSNAKRCALVAVDEIINILPSLEDEYELNSTEYSERVTDYWFDYQEGWKQVKQEIEKL